MSLHETALTTWTPCGRHRGSSGSHARAAREESLHLLSLLHSQAAPSLSVILLTRTHQVSVELFWGLLHTRVQPFDALNSITAYVWVKVPIWLLAISAKSYTPSLQPRYLAVKVVCTRFLSRTYRLHNSERKRLSRGLEDQLSGPNWA